MKQLPDITLLAICCDGREVGTIKSLQTCMSYFDFGEVKYVSDSKPDMLPDTIKWEYCPKITNTHMFDVYSFEEMHRHIDTSHMLMVQDHSGIIYPELWEDEWLQWDYIGAPFPIRPEFFSVSTGELVRQGNGGFSLRSKKLLSLPHELGLKCVYDRGFSNDDGLFCSYYRKTFLEHGINYADVNVAAKFAFETLTSETISQPSFGFHRYRNPTVK
jgi:hypothetical protein